MLFVCLFCGGVSRDSDEGSFLDLVPKGIAEFKSTMILTRQERCDVSSAIKTSAESSVRWLKVQRRRKRHDLDCFAGGARSPALLRSYAPIQVSSV